MVLNEIKTHLYLAKMTLYIQRLKMKIDNLNLIPLQKYWNKMLTLISVTLQWPTILHIDKPNSCSLRLSITESTVELLTVLFTSWSHWWTDFERIPAFSLRHLCQCLVIAVNYNDNDWHYQIAPFLRKAWV